MSRRRHQRGQSLTEYALLMCFALAVMFTPVFELEGEPGRYSIVGLFVRAFDIYINSFHAVITMPIP
jgi:ABC-type transporter Mla subunit MlaD